MQIIHWFVFDFDYAYLIRLSDVTNVYNMAASITVHLKIFKRPQLPHFSTDLDETGIKIHGLLRSFILIVVIIRVAVPFNVMKIILDTREKNENWQTVLLIMYMLLIVITVEKVLVTVFTYLTYPILTSGKDKK